MKAGIYYSTASNLYANIIYDFTLPEKFANGENFRSYIFEIYNDIFLEFINNKKKKLNDSNMSDVKIFKGFMNFIGILFNKTLVTEECVIRYTNQLFELIEDQKILQEEKNNYFAGWYQLINQILFRFENTSYSNSELLSVIQQKINQLQILCEFVDKTKTEQQNRYMRPIVPLYIEMNKSPLINICTS